MADRRRLMMVDYPDPAGYPLAALIHCADCRTPMTPAVRAATRVYRCTGACRNEIDALHAETLMWDRAAARQPQLARPRLPADRRREVFASLLTEMMFMSTSRRGLTRLLTDFGSLTGFVGLGREVLMHSPDVAL
ncbi:hypothetical protein [Solwaraspora sp. WMMA2065]|uniref:hypothetical protein n=1 Tax=Solwaraspora sp. WMMA2065 TaxID=3015166 RepID=UPI00259BEF1F|nr:hypothetical protein [Solwaraspora sp. WMMA2065]WJK36853.1 hypothetical protein O7610_11180 [Solwaraspora sp. WMMA2065]